MHNQVSQHCFIYMLIIADYLIIYVLSQWVGFPLLFTIQCQDCCSVVSSPLPCRSKIIHSSIGWTVCLRYSPWQYLYLIFCCASSRLPSSRKNCLRSRRSLSICGWTVCVCDSLWQYLYLIFHQAQVFCSLRQLSSSLFYGSISIVISRTVSLHYSPWQYLYSIFCPWSSIESTNRHFLWDKKSYPSLVEPCVCVIARDDINIQSSAVRSSLLSPRKHFLP